MGESRVELLAWINALLQLNFTKIEQLGTGAAYCQVFDSIWGDLQMHKVKFDAKHEYEYVANFKVMQLALDQHKVDKAVPVERLVKCKFQDNLDFLQWIKQFHDMHFPGGYYDAAARRHHKPSTLKSSKSSSSHSLTSGRSATSTMTTRAPTTRAAPTSSMGARKPSVTNSRPGSAHGVAASSAAMQNLQRQVDDLTRTNDEQSTLISTLERERDFYYSKLRDIEILVQQEAARGQTSDLMTLIQQILYATDDGFEVPEEAGDVSLDQQQQHYGHDGAHHGEYMDDEHMGQHHMQHHQHYEQGEYLDDEPMPAGNGHSADDMETF
ncbi:calponin homology domain-containing protein [Catenaria anguillulae PL171]|uniref:Calponin homology domain-containing protein n=1 Tax=Catenaria anguillulae PL171 TaxID=765915 RepID=A0A1Y2HJU5_9FUNG|nr:calponin homology domain-containing protein [Catenaria anguillulae PL171]